MAKKPHLHLDSFLGDLPEINLNLTTTPKLVGIRPVGAQIVVELLDAQEALGTSLTVNAEADVGAPQGYVIAIGPKLDPDFGVKEGDRVLLQGTSVPVARFGNSKRRKVVVEAHCVKAVLEEVK